MLEWVSSLEKMSLELNIHSVRVHLGGTKKEILINTLIKHFLLEKVHTHEAGRYRGRKRES